MANEGIGASVLRKEDARFLTGRGRYTDDLAVPGALHVAFARSPHAHARLGAIDTSAALATPGVVAVFTGADLLAAGVAPIGLDFRPRGADGKWMVVPPRRPLAAERVRYVGDPVAMVVAETVNAAKDGAEALAIEYEELPPVVTFDAALAPGAPPLWPDIPGNVLFEMRYGDAAAVDRAFEQAAHRVTLDLVNQRVVVNPLEPRAACAEYDAHTGRYTLTVSHQTPFPLQSGLAEVLGVEEQAIRVVSYDVGGGFGVKGATYPEEAALLWAASRLERPVRWRCERTELFLSDSHARDHVTTATMAVDADARFLALRIDDLANIGGYVSSFGAGPPLFAQAVLSAGQYLTPAIAGRVRMVMTNTQPTDAYRGPGRAETAYLIERIVDCVARELKLAPDEVRRRNLVPPAAMPYKTPLGRVYDSGDFPRGLALALEHADAVGFPARRAASKARGWLRGIGLSAYLDHTGMGPSDMIISRGMKFGAYESAQVRLDRRGKVVVHTGTHSHGQGLETALAQLVAERFGLSIAEVDVRHGDTSDLAIGRGTVGARSLLAGGSAIGVALDKIVAKGKRIAAHAFECAPDDVAFERGVFAVAGTDKRLLMREIAERAYYPASYPLRELEPGLDEGGYWDPTAVSIPNGCYVCEVEIDPDTGTVAIAQFVCVDDFGTVVNPMIVDGQVHGGVVQGLGQAMLEHAVYDSASGQLLTGSFMDYAMPRADDLPSFVTASNPTPTATNPLGVKGCGEAGTIGAPPAYVNAVVDALAPYGVRHLDMPVTAERVWRAIQAGR
jgi:aerobic carbon-monoxide dehydrogenase large subunit